MAEDIGPPPNPLPEGGGIIVVELKHPITANGEEVREIRLTRPKVKQLKAMDACAGNVARVCALIGEIAALPPSAVDQIDAQDFMEITAKLGDFFGLSPLIGGG